MATVLTLGDDSIAFDDFNQLIDWLAAERTKWEWVNGRGPAQNAWNTTSYMYNELHQDALRNAQQGQPLHAVVPTIESRFANGPLVYSNSEEGRRILDLRATEGDDAAAAAYAFYRQQMSLGEIRSLQSLRGVMAFAYPATAPVATLLNELSAERKQLRRSVTELNTRYGAKEADFTRQFEDLLSSRKSLANEAIRAGIDEAQRVSDERKAAWSEVLTRAEQAVLELQTTEVAFAEKLGLEAPVMYWKRKARIHKAKEARHLRMLRFFFGGAAIAILFVFYQAATKLHDLVVIPTAVVLVAGAGLALFAALVLWVARILTRLYLSEHHLRTDADERATMANAYLALIYKGSLEAADRAIILQALFRPSSDGVVKDEGPPDLNAIIALSKIGMPSPTR